MKNEAVNVKYTVVSTMYLLFVWCFLIFRATYEYEKKVYNDHLESLQVMEKNYMTMASEVEKLRAELKKHAENDRRAGTSFLI